MKFNRRSIVFLSAGLFYLFTAYSTSALCQIQESVPDTCTAMLKDELRDKLDEFRKEHKFPGAVLAYAFNDGREGAVASGLSDLEEKTKMTVDDWMLSGSIGKTYVAAVALQLVGEGKLVLDSKISKWLGKEKWFPRLPNSRDITVRMLMNHTSGIPEHVLLPEYGKAVGDSPDRIWRPEERLEYILDAEPKFKTGEGWSYADTNYIVLGVIIEKITGATYYDELKRRILMPLKLKFTQIITPRPYLSPTPV